MLKFSKLEPERVYRVTDKFTLPYNDRNIQRGNLITVLSRDINHTLTFLNTNYLNKMGYNRYYIERLMTFKIAGLNVREKNLQKEMYEEHIVKSNIDYKLMVNPAMAGDFNVIYEMGQFMDTINSSDRINRRPIFQKMDLRFDLLVERLKLIGSEFPIQDKYLYIPVADYISNTKDTALWTNRANLELWPVILIKKMETEYEKFATELKDWTFVFMNVNELFYINASDINEDTFNSIKLLFKKYMSTNRRAMFDDVQEDETKNVKLDDSVENTISTTVNKTADGLDINVSNIEKNVTKAIKSKVITAKQPEPKKEPEKAPDVKEKKKKEETLTNTTILKKDKPKEEPKKVEDKPKQEIDIKKEIVKEVEKETKKEIDKLLKPSDVSIQRLARIKEIQKNIKNLKVNDKTLEEIKIEAKKKSIDKSTFDINVINDKMKNMDFNNFDKGYNDKLFNYDLSNILTSFAEKDRPLYLIKLDAEDTSTVIDKKITYTCLYEDEFGKRHTLTFDLPKFVNDKFMHLNRSDKIFVTQIIPLPITKTSPDTVQISSNYQKVFINRFGTNISPKITRFHTIVNTIPNNILKVARGNNLQANLSYLTTLEYDELSTKYTAITLEGGDLIVYLNQDEIRLICKQHNLKYTDKELPFAIRKNKGNFELITLDVNKDKIYGTDISPIDYIINNIDNYIPNFKHGFAKINVGKRMVYTRATIMAKRVPIVLLLSFLIGLEPLMNRIKLNYTFTEKRPILDDEESLNKTIIQFKDGYLVYDQFPFSNSLLMNGLIDIPTKEYEFLQFSGKDVYYDIFQLMFGRRNIGNAFDNFNQLFVDPVTKEVLEDYDLPTNFIDIIIYGNTLLENNTYDLDGSLKSYRIRTNEMVNAHLYKVLSKAYESYRMTADQKNPQKFTIKKNAIINDIFDSQVLEEYSVLNPIFEIERMRSTSFKGVGGCNMDRAFSINKRAYNETMLGVLAQSSPISSNIGIARTMSVNPNVKSLRGYIEPGSIDTVNDLDSTKLLSGAELLVPFGPTHDDPQRVSMSSTQSRHTISTVDSDVPLFGYGFDRTLSHVISDRFAFKAKKNGRVIEINDKLDFIMIEYDDGARDIIDISNKQELNTGSGFYITNKIVSNKKVGEKFKEGDVIARNDDFFEYDPSTNDTIYKSGPLARVAVMHGSSVYEDSTLLSERLAERMSSYITLKKEITIGKNSNVYHISNIGDKVEVNDPLLVFDESYEDDYLNKLLSKINNDVKEDIIEAAHTPIKSKINGEIIDVKIYYTVPKEELSESLQKIITNYEKNIRKRLNIFKKNNIEIKDMTTLNDIDTAITPINGKVKGVKMEDNHVLIEFYIRTLDKFSVGDKCTYATALKGIDQSLIPKGQEPYLASDPSKKIDAIMGVSGYYSRMTNSFALSMAMNAVILGLEDKIKDMYEEFTKK